MTKCTICDRKLRLAQQINCKCLKMFCLQHRNDHLCTFDYKKYHKEHLKQRNPKIETLKINVL
jgi:hypothetical protein